MSRDEILLQFSFFYFDIQPNRFCACLDIFFLPFVSSPFCERWKIGKLVNNSPNWIIESTKQVLPTFCDKRGCEVFTKRACWKAGTTKSNMAWGFWSASTVSDRRSPRRATTATSSAMYYQPQQQQLQQPQCNVTVNQCMQPEEPIQVMPIPVQQQQKQGQMTSVCGSPCQSVCHTPTCISPSCQSGTTGKRYIQLQISLLLSALVCRISWAAAM